MNMVLHFIELTASIICTILCMISTIPDTVQNNWSLGCFFAMTFGGYVIVLVASLFTKCVSQDSSKMPRLFTFIYSLIGMVLFITCGTIAISIYSAGKYSNTGFAGGIIAIINSVVFLIDAFISLRKLEDDDY